MHITSDEMQGRSIPKWNSLLPPSLCKEKLGKAEPEKGTAVQPCGLCSENT